MMDYNINLNQENILITGCAGFIGAFLAMDIIKKYPDAKIILTHREQNIYKEYNS